MGSTRLLRHDCFDMTASTRRRQLLILPVAASLTGVAVAAGPLKRDTSGDTVHGHDPVACFVDGTAVNGRVEHSANAQGATYWFSTEAKLMTFRADPAEYEPQWGGCCAYGAAKGFKPHIDPTALKIEGGKLYLNLNPAVQKRWPEDIPGYITQATKNGSTLKSQ